MQSNKIGIRIIMIVVAIMSSYSCAQEPIRNLKCEVDNEALRSMPYGVVSFTLANGEKMDVEVKLADNVRTRAAGFQRVCASTVSSTPILFIFEAELVPSFHMRNVVTPLDIAFIAKDGSVDSIHAMKTYVLGSTKRPLYSSKGPIIAALEVEPGFYSRKGIDQSTHVTWRRAVGRD